MTATATEFPAYAPGREPRPDGTIFQDPELRSHESAEEAAKLETLVSVAREKGWREGVRAAHGESLLGYVDNPDRLIFLSLLPLKPTDRILEIGPGLGQISLPIAKRVKSVDALEVVAGQAKFGAERAREEGITNIRFTTGGDKCLLPYADESFDGVVFNLVLEWCANRLDHMSHRDAHLLLLSEIARVLKPGGFFYVVTKNRFGLRCLTGGRDEHMWNMRFGSALPRWLGSLLTGGRRSPGYLHSHNELKNMLRQSGFDDIQSFWATPEMRWPTKIVPLDDELGVARRAVDVPQGENPRTDRLMRLLPDGLVKHFTPGLTFLARKRK